MAKHNRPIKIKWKLHVRIRAANSQEAIEKLRSIIAEIIKTDYATFAFIEPFFTKAITRFGATKGWFSPNATRNIVHGKLLWTNRAAGGWREMPVAYDKAAAKVSVKGAKRPVPQTQVFYRDNRGRFASRTSSGIQPEAVKYYRDNKGRFAKKGGRKK